MNKKKILLALLALTVIAIGLNILYSNWKHPQTGIILTDTKNNTHNIDKKDFEASSPKEMSVVLTRKNGEKIPRDYYAASLVDIINAAKITDDYQNLIVVASDHFEAKFTKDELPLNVYLSYNDKDNIYETFVLKDEFSTRCVRDIKEIILSE